MEQSISSLTFTGSIPEAITEAKNQKKLFIVYISGEDEESLRLEKSLWADSRVAECITKYCVLLHIPEGTNDATNFSAIYPQKSPPCITAVGYTGVLLWQNEGFISPDNLVSSIEKAWLGLHIPVFNSCSVKSSSGGGVTGNLVVVLKETTASVLTAALSSNRNDQSLDGASTTTSAPREDGDSSSSNSQVPSEERSKALESGQLAPPEVLDQDVDGKRVPLAPVESPKKVVLKMDDNEQSVPLSEAVEVVEPSRGPAVIDQDNREVSRPSHVENECPNREDAASSDNNMHESNYPLKAVNREIKGDLHDKASALVENKDSSTGVSDDTSSELLLNIRLPNGASLQDKFLKVDALRLVKDYVDRNMADFNGSYDLAIPYPRKVFKDQDMDKSLAEHGIINRQGLIVVPHQRALRHIERGSSSDASKFAADTDSSTRVGGYFGYVRKMLSYVNPFSYVGGAGSSTSSQESPSGIWEYGPNPATQNNISRENPTTSTSSRNDGSIRRRSTSRIGSNIHTLKHDEDDMYDDRNTYWNGNSTQFGGNDNDK